MGEVPSPRYAPKAGATDPPPKGGLEEGGVAELETAIKW